jgi:hypothetical protein
VEPDPFSEDYDDIVCRLQAAYGDPDKSNPYYDKQAYKRMLCMMKNTFAGLGFDVDKLELKVTYRH